jgi:hypothetical protein
MPPEEPQSKPIPLSELLDAFEFVSVSDLDEHQAYVCKRTGRIIFVSEGLDLEEGAQFPEDPDVADYQAVPHRRDLNLGRWVALSFVAQELPDRLEMARDIFSRKGAYGRFKHLLQAANKLDAWYAFEARAAEAALEAWCEDVGVTLIDNSDRSDARPNDPKA